MTSMEYEVVHELMDGSNRWAVVPGGYYLERRFALARAKNEAATRTDVTSRIAVHIIDRSRTDPRFSSYDVPIPYRERIWWEGL